MLETRESRWAASHFSIGKVWELRDCDEDSSIAGGGGDGFAVVVVAGSTVCRGGEGWMDRPRYGFHSLRPPLSSSTAPMRVRQHLQSTSRCTSIDERVDGVVGAAPWIWGCGVSFMLQNI